MEIESIGDERKDWRWESQLEIARLEIGLEMKEGIGDVIEDSIGIRIDWIYMDWRWDRLEMGSIGDGLEIGSIGDDIKERIGDRIGWR